MSSTPDSLRRELLVRLLEAHERSASYGRTTPWPRDVILKLDARAFPDAHAPDGRESRAALLHAALALESEGRVRLVRHARGPLAGEPKEIRMGAAEVAPAAAAAVALGWEPLAVGLAAVAERSSELAAEPAPAWMRAFLRGLAEGAARADLSILGMSRQRFKACWPDLVQALAAAAALASGVAPAWERVASERLFGDSKVLARIRPLVVGILVRADPRWNGVPPEEATELLESYGVRRKPGLIRSAGAATLQIDARSYRLEDFVPVAHLPDTWAEAWIEALLERGVRQVTTIENEYPFLAYVEEAGGPAGLGARGEVAVYTAGFPAPGLVRALARLAERDDRLRFRHWGDADVGGLRIWWFLRQRIGRSMELFRTTAAWVRAESTRGGRPLSKSERGALVHLRAELDAIGGTDVAAARALITAILETGVKIEQERY